MPGYISMFALINKFSKKNNKTEADGETKASKPTFVMPTRIDDDELKRRIAAKLEDYRPLNRDSNFGAPRS